MDAVLEIDELNRSVELRDFLQVIDKIIRGADGFDDDRPWPASEGIGMGVGADRAQHPS